MVVVARADRSVRDVGARLRSARNAYLVLLVTILLWPKDFSRHQVRSLHYTAHHMLDWPRPLDFTLNVVLLVPLGAFVYLFTRWNRSRAYWMLVVPYACEVVQAFAGRLHRAATLWDIVAYTVGIALGFVACVAFDTRAARANGR